MMKTFTYFLKFQKLLSIFLFVFVGFASFAKPYKNVANALQNVQYQVQSELEVEPNDGILNFDFEVRTLGSRRFMVSFTNPDAIPAYVRVYDAIGNVVNQESVAPKGRFSRQYDMSKSKSEMYIIEVGNGKYNNTKRVFLD
jgi:hypothetical protein